MLRVTSVAAGQDKKNSYREGDYKTTKKDLGGGLFSKLRIWVGRGKKIFSSQAPCWKKSFENVFLTFFMGQGGGNPGKCYFVSIGEVNICLSEGD